MANVTIRALAKKELTNTLPPEERRVLYDPRNRAQWRQELLTLLEEKEARKLTLHTELEADLTRYNAISTDSGSLQLEAIKAYQDALRKLNNFSLRAQRRVVELDRINVIQKEANPHINFFAEAIREHRRLSMEAGREIEDQDVALWDTLEGHWRFS